MTSQFHRAAWLVATGLLLAGFYVMLRRPAAVPVVTPPSLAHADHSPRHGGVFFMAPNGIHHLEGTLREDEFRLYLYDHFTQPIDARPYQARVGNRRLEAAPNGEYLRLQLDSGPGPIEVTAFVRFASGREERFDFVFHDSGQESPWHVGR